MNTKHSIRTVVALLVAMLAVCSAAAAQRTWVVEIFGRGDFTDIPPAVAAAAPGDTIEVRSDSSLAYSAVTIDKGLNVLATPSWNHHSAITIENLPADQTFRLCGFQGWFALDIRNCAGRVHIDILGMGDPISPLSRGHVRIENCRLVTANNFWVMDFSVTNSTFMASHSAIRGWPDPPPFGRTATPAITMVDSDVTLVETRLWGATAYPMTGSPTMPVAPKPGIEMRGGSLKITGTDWSYVQGGQVFYLNPTVSFQGPAIHSDGGQVFIDPDVRLAPLYGTAYSGTSPLVVAEIPYVSVQHIEPGANLNCFWYSNCVELRAAPNTPALVAASLPADRIPTPFGDLWLDTLSGSTIAIGVGVTDSTGLLRTPVDFSRVLRPGDPVTFQAILIEPTGLRLTAPAIPVLGVY